MQTIIFFEKGRLLSAVLTNLYQKIKSGLTQQKILLHSKKATYVQYPMWSTPTKLHSRSITETQKQTFV